MVYLGAIFVTDVSSINTFYNYMCISIIIIIVNTSNNLNKYIY